MNLIEMPVSRLTADCIWNSFQSSHKRHLILTGRRKSGKSTLLSRLFPHPLPGITTWAEPGKAVYLKENSTGMMTRVGIYDHSLPGTEHKMQLSSQGFHTLGNAALRRCAQNASEWISIDEIGYLETGCPDYCREIRRLMEQKRLIAVVRKQSLPFLEELCHHREVFLVDLDAPFGRTGCVIMASGLGRRFGGNKLMADFKGKPLIQWTFAATEEIFERRIVVTRHKAVEDLCRAQGIEVITHNLPYRSDTIRLGLEAISRDVDSCMFCTGDQPLLGRDTIASLALSAANGQEYIWRAAWKDTPGAPVLFPRWTFAPLLTLPEEEGGSFVVKKYPGQVHKIPVRDPYELMDVDSPEDLRVLSASTHY